MTRLCWIAPLAVVMTACATSYVPDTGSGGYSETRLGDEVYEVQFRGNRYTSAAAARELLLRRCAEITLQEGFDAFRIVEEADARSVASTGSESYRRITGSEVETVNKCATGSVRPETSEIAEQPATIVRPLSVARIRLVRDAADDGDPALYDAHHILGTSAGG